MYCVNSLSLSRLIRIEVLAGVCFCAWRINTYLQAICSIVKDLYFSGLHVSPLLSEIVFCGCFAIIGCGIFFVLGKVKAPARRLAILFPFVLIFSVIIVHEYVYFPVLKEREGTCMEDNSVSSADEYIFSDEFVAQKVGGDMNNR